MTLQARLPAPTVFRSAVAAIFAVVSMFLLALGTATAAPKGISLELNDAQTVAGACIGSFVLKNDLGHTLDRFQLDLFVFGDDGVIKLRSNIDLAPVRGDKTTVISFRILPEPCAAVARVLVNDIPLCRAQSGNTLDCLSGLTVSSRNRIRLEK
ncbi:MAG: hypothetical protein GKS00_07955 [Alphaproteobacteria bacterium]|nr:hypothetical protein [Alphaproteobacteria bacterium]